MAVMIKGWSPFIIMFNNPVLYSRWSLLLKIEISLIYQYCFISSQIERKTISSFKTFQHHCSPSKIPTVRNFFNLPKLTTLHFKDSTDTHFEFCLTHVLLFIPHFSVGGHVCKKIYQKANSFEFWKVITQIYVSRKLPKSLK